MVSQDPAQRVRANVGPGGRLLREILLDQTDAGRALRWLTTKATEPRSLVLGFALAFVAFAIYWFVNNNRRASLDYYVPLANAFLHGRLGFEVEPPSGGYNKLVPFGGQLFVVYPPMPAVVLMPFVLLFGEGIDQARVAILFGALNVALAMWVALGVGAGGRSAVRPGNRLRFRVDYVVPAQAGTSWHIAHVMALTFALAAIGLAVRNRPPWLIGLLVAAMGLCRLPMLLGAPFFLAYIVHLAARSDTGSPAFGTSTGARDLRFSPCRCAA